MQNPQKKVYTVKILSIIKVLNLIDTSVSVYVNTTRFFNVTPLDIVFIKGV